VNNSQPTQPTQAQPSQAAQPAAKADSGWMSAWGKSDKTSTESDTEPSSFTSELSQAVGSVREKKRTKTKDTLRGSFDDLDDI
jgi:hypothetical protein